MPSVQSHKAFQEPAKNPKRRLIHLLSGVIQHYEAELETAIFELAGEPFLIASPKQLQVILFDKLGLKPLRKTKTGFSTDVSVLEQLASKHPLPAKILE